MNGGQLGLHSGILSTLDLIHMTQKKWKNACRVKVAEVTFGPLVLEETSTDAHTGSEEIPLKKTHAHTPEKFQHPGIIIKLSELRMIDP